MTLLTFNEKYVVSSVSLVSTTSTTLVDDTEAVQQFSLSASKVVLIIYQANNVHGATQSYYGRQNAIKIDDIDYANSWDSTYDSNYVCRNFVFWIGTLASGSHTVKGRFASNYSGSTATISNRVLLIIIFDGDEFSYLDDATLATTTSNTLVDDPNASFNFTPSGDCKALILYNATNPHGATEERQGKKIAINIGGSDYGQAEQSLCVHNFANSVFTVNAVSLSAVSATVKGRFANNNDSVTVSVSRRQFGVLLLADSTLLNIITSTTQVSTTSSSLVDDAEATIQRTTSDVRELLVIAMGTKREGTSSSGTGECYGIKINTNDRANSRASPNYSTRSNSAATAYAEQLAAASHTIKGRFSNNNGSDVSKIDARQVLALWFSIAGGVTYEIYVDAIAKSSGSPAEECTFNVEKEAIARSDSLEASETTFNVSKDAIIKALSDYNLESLFNVLKDAVGQVTAAVSVEQLKEVFKDAAVQTLATQQVESVFSVNKDAAVIVDVTRLIQSMFSLGLDAVVKVLAEVSVVKEGEVKVTRLFLVFGDLAVQIQGD